MDCTELAMVTGKTPRMVTGKCIPDRGDHLCPLGLAWVFLTLVLVERFFHFCRWCIRSRARISASSSRTPHIPMPQMYYFQAKPVLVPSGSLHGLAEEGIAA
jgi:hypothetical protein